MNYPQVYSIIDLLFMSFTLGISGVAIGILVTHYIGDKEEAKTKHLLIDIEKFLYTNLLNENLSVVDRNEIIKLINRSESLTGSHEPK